MNDSNTDDEQILLDNAALNYSLRYPSLSNIDAVSMRMAFREGYAYYKKRNAALQSEVERLRAELADTKEKLQIANNSYNVRSNAIVQLTNDNRSLREQAKERDEVLRYVKNYLGKGGFGRVDCLKRVEAVLEKYKQPEQ